MNLKRTKKHLFCKGPSQIFGLNFWGFDFKSDYWNRTYKIIWMVIIVHVLHMSCIVDFVVIGFRSSEEKEESAKQIVSVQPVPSKVLSKVLLDRPHARSQRRKAFRVQRVRPRLSYQVPLGAAYAHPHGGKALPVLHMWPALLPKI